MVALSRPHIATPRRELIERIMFILPFDEPVVWDVSDHGRFGLTTHVVLMLYCVPHDHLPFGGLRKLVLLACLLVVGRHIDLSVFGRGIVGYRFLGAHHFFGGLVKLPTVVHPVDVIGDFIL